MYKAEIIKIKKSDKLWKQLDHLCFLSKNLYNYANYIIRQEFIKNRTWIRYQDLNKKFIKEKQIDYFSLPNNSSQQILMILDKNWKSFFKAIKDYMKNKNKYKKKPNLPKYKDKKTGRNILTFSTNQCKIKNGYLYFPKKANINSIKTRIKNLKMVRIIPDTYCYKIEIVYKQEKEIKNDLNEKNYLSIDLGINNLCSLTTNQILQPILINGRIIKSINQYYNKKQALYQSYIGDKGISNRIKKLNFKRENLINNYFHHISKWIVKYCIEHNIKNIVIGYNQGWKQEINIGKINNQKFVSIPYLKLIQQLQYKAEENNINVIVQEESYTSKIDSLALESIEKHESYLGKRIKRGLFQSSIGKFINADVNGAINILRKVIGNDFIKNLSDRGYIGYPLEVIPSSYNFGFSKI